MQFEPPNTKTKINKNLRWLVMPDFVYSDNRLNDTSRRVYCFIHTFKGDLFYFGNPHLAEMFNCSEWSISQAMTQLQELGYIDTVYEQKAGGGKIRYVRDLKFEFINSYAPVQDWENPKSKIGKTQSRIKATKIGKTQSGNEAKTAEGNDINNDNNLMGKIEIEEKDFKDKEWLEARRERSARKGSGGVFPQRSGFGSQPSSYKKKEYQVREKKGAHGEHVI